MATTNINLNKNTAQKKEEEVHGWYVRETFDMSFYLHNRLRGQLKYFNDKSSSEKDKFIKYQWTLIICSALTPVLVSATQADFGEYKEIINGLMYWATLGISVVVSIMAAALKTFKYQENWATTRAVCEMINREKFLYEAGVGEYADKGKRDALFVERIEGLLAREQNQWLGAATQNTRTEDVKDADKDGIPDEIDTDVDVDADKKNPPLK